MELNDIIVSLAKEYLKPLSPIFKVEFFQSHIIYVNEDDDLDGDKNIIHTCKKENLFMLKDTTELINYSYNSVLTISPKAIEKYNNDKYLIIEGDSSYENIIIIDIVRVA